MRSAVRTYTGLGDAHGRLLDSLDLDADALEGLGQFGELGEGGFEVLDDLGGDDAGGGQVVGVLEALVAEPEDVEAGLVPGDQLVVGEAAEPLGLLALAALAGLVARRRSRRGRLGAAGWSSA